MSDAFRTDLKDLINRHSLENASNTPDFILADYLTTCLHAFDGAMERRVKWYAPAGTEGDTKKEAFVREHGIGPEEMVQHLGPDGEGKPYDV